VDTDFLIWTFCAEGEYTIELVITDINDNKYRLRRNGFIKVKIDQSKDIRKISGFDSEFYIDNTQNFNLQELLDTAFIDRITTKPSSAFESVTYGYPPLVPLKVDVQAYKQPLLWLTLETPTEINQSSAYRYYANSIYISNDVRISNEIFVAIWSSESIKKSALNANDFYVEYIENGVEKVKRFEIESSMEPTIFPQNSQISVSQWILKNGSLREYFNLKTNEIKSYYIIPKNNI
jgi:hypothetical protein